ncbi:glycoside hydrolase family protein [Caudoviricetes sp.]|nr:glycoside hydrolase family protein [Caudoviricetes sp.]UOF82722.1 glycoside hydrolase family protein [Caudoviricetes sp.]
MGFHEVSFPQNVAYGSRGGISHDTKIIELDGGSEERISRRGARMHFNAKYGIRTLSDLRAVQRFIRLREGATNGFRFKDWLDYASTTDGGTLADGAAANTSNQDQVIGTGNGTNKIFQLSKTYTDGVYTKVRNVTKPISGTALLALGASAQTESTHYSIDYTTGIVTFVTAPTAGTQVKAGFQYEAPVRFDEDADQLLDVSVEAFNAGDLPDVGMTELIDELPNPDVFWTGGAVRMGAVNVNVTISLLTGRAISLEPNTVGLKLFLPSATSIPVGGPHFAIKNEGTQSIDIRTSGDAAVITLAVSATTVLYLGYDSSGLKQWWAF